MKLLNDNRGMELLEAAITTPIAIMVMLAIVNLGMLVYAQQAVQAAARHGARMGSVAQQCPACYAISGAKSAIAQAGILENTSVSVLAPGGSAGSILKIQVSGSVPNFMAPLTSLFPGLARADVYCPSGFDISSGGLVMMWRDRRGYAMTFWAVFIGLVMVPALALAIELGRYFYAISEVAKAADAAAVAASAEINQQVFQDTGSLVPTSRTWANAQSYVTSNTTGLSAKGVHAFVTGIHVSGGDNTVRVDVSADLTILFPSVVPKVLVTQNGVANLRAFTH